MIETCLLATCWSNCVVSDPDHLVRGTHWERTGLRNGHHLHFYVEVRPFVDDDTRFAFFRDIEVGCAIAVVAFASARHSVLLLALSVSRSDGSLR